MKGHYNEKGLRTGLWSYYDETEDLIREIEYGSSTNAGNKIKETTYTNGIASVTFDQGRFIRFFWTNLRYISWILGLILILRSMLNSQIINAINGTSYTLFYLKMGKNWTIRRNHSIASVYKAWWNLNEPDTKNQTKAKLSNGLGLFVLIAFLIILLGLFFSDAI